jgi:HPt (histidine-containing phosphotransfer) domain-containing protein
VLNLQYKSETLLNAAVLKELNDLDLGDGMGSPLLPTLVDVFEETASETLLAIQKSAEVSEFKAFAEGVHKLKGSSGSIGAFALFECCRVVDELCKSSQLVAEDLPVCADAIGYELGRAKIALVDYVAQISRH